VVAAGFVNTPDADPQLGQREVWVAQKVSHGEDGWVRILGLDGYDDHYVSVLRDLSDESRPRIVGVRVEPRPGGDVAASWKSHRPQWHIDPSAAPAVTKTDMSRLPWAYIRQIVRASLLEDPWKQPVERKPQGGSDDHEAKVRQVVAQAELQGKTSARALISVFTMVRSTAYRRITDYGIAVDSEVSDTTRDTTAPKHGNT
jgi:hypothetical protein